MNIGRFCAAIDDAIMHGFRRQLDPINAIADRSSGFVWRLQTEDGNATAIRPYADERMAINMSVWESLDALQQYVYKGAHVGPLRDRKEWFEPIDGSIPALWWVPASQIPTVAEALDRLEHLEVHGPTREAFTFRTPFAPPDSASELPALDAEFCELGQGHSGLPRARRGSSRWAGSGPSLQQLIGEGRMPPTYPGAQMVACTNAWVT